MLTVRAHRVALPDGVRPAAIHIVGGRIVSVSGREEVPAGSELIDAGDLVVLPGLVDTHVHINDPGRAEWEGFEHATRAAAAGGVTTLVDMPLNSLPPTIDVAAFEAKQRSAEGRAFVDVGFWGGVVPGNSAHLAPMFGAGVLGFKCFLAPSGVEEFRLVTEEDLRRAAPILARLGAPLLVHAEHPGWLRDPLARVDGRPGDAAGADPRRYATWLASRPPDAEHAAIELLIQLVREFSVRVHIVHLASSLAVPLIEKARAGGLPISVETCPHYLYFAAEEIPDGATAFKCAPPIRERAHRDGLWNALRRGAIDLVVTDHSPSPPELKRPEDGDFARAWGGIASLQLGLAATWTAAVERGFDIPHVIEWMAAAPARLAGLAERKGAIAPGRDADLVLWDPEAQFMVDPAALYHRHPVTSYAGACLRGVVRKTLVRGEVVFEDGVCRPAARGRRLLRGSA